MLNPQSRLVFDRGQVDSVSSGVRAIDRAQGVMLNAKLDGRAVFYKHDSLLGVSGKLHGLVEPSNLFGVRQGTSLAVEKGIVSMQICSES